MQTLPKAFYDAFPVRKRPAIGLDLDGVAVDFAGRILSVVNEEWSTSFTLADWTDYYGGNIFAGRGDALKELVADPLNYLMARPIKGAVRSIRTLSEYADIHFITCRPANCEDATDAWLYANNLYVGNLVVTQGSKSDIVKDMDLLAFVDDRAEYARELVPYVGASVLFDSPWNQGTVEGTVRLRGWMAALEFLLRRCM